MKSLLIDARMINHSGIGRYLKCNLDYIIPNFKGNICLIGKKEDLKTYENFNNVKVIDNNTPIYSLKEQYIIYKYAKKYDLLWVPHYNVPIFSKNFIVTIHDMFHIDNPQWVNGIIKKIYPRILFKIINNRAKKIFTVSNFTKKRYEELIGNREVVVTYNGIDPEWFRYTSGLVPNKKKPYLLYVGNIKPHKNIKNLLKAFKIIQENFDIDLVVIGKKEGFITGEDNIAELLNGIEKNVLFTGFVPDEQLKDYFKNAALFVFPSFYEGFGIPPLEAMALGCPTVVSSAASIPEVCEDATLYFDPSDDKDMAIKIMNVLSDENLRDELIKKGKKQALKFKWESSAEKLLKEIEEVLID